MGFIDVSYRGIQVCRALPWVEPTGEWANQTMYHCATVIVDYFNPEACYEFALWCDLFSLEPHNSTHKMQVMECLWLYVRELKSYDDHRIILPLMEQILGYFDDEIDTTGIEWSVNRSIQSLNRQ